MIATTALAIKCRRRRKPSRLSGAERGLTAGWPPEALSSPSRITGRGMARLRGRGCLAVKAALKVPAPRPAPCPRLADDEGVGWGLSLSRRGAGRGCGPLSVGRESNRKGAGCERSAISVESLAGGGAMTDRGTDNSAPVHRRHRTEETGNGTRCPLDRATARHMAQTGRVGRLRRRLGKGHHPARRIGGCRVTPEKVSCACMTPASPAPTAPHEGSGPGLAPRSGPGRSPAGEVAGIGTGKASLGAVAHRKRDKNSHRRR